MALDPTARQANFIDSIKKFFVDNINRIEGLPLLFDRSLVTPQIQGVEVDKWVAVAFGDMNMGHVSDSLVEVYCCSRRDPEGFKLAQIRDKVVGYLTDSERTDGLRRIPLYKTPAWTQVGSLIVYQETESGILVTSDETKFKIVPARFKWAAII